MLYFTEIQEREILMWKEDDNVFSETHNFQRMIEKVRNQPYVTFVGAPGSGKTATARHIALKLQDEGYGIIPIKDIKDIETYCDPHKPQVFVIDDVLGVFGLDWNKFDLLTQYKDKLTDPVMPKTKILMTCREIVYRNRNVYESNSFIDESENVVLLHSKENALNDSDKRDLLSKYHLDTTLLTSTDLTLASNMFPFLCKLYSKEFKHWGSRFFIYPVPCILRELDLMKKRSKYQYSSLVLLMINKNKLSEEILQNKPNYEGKLERIKLKVLERCEVMSSADSFKFIHALKEMEGTYTRKSGTEFTFIHDSLFEIIAYHFGCQNPEMILQHMRSDYIVNYVKVDTYDNVEKASSEHESTIDMCIPLQESHHGMFAERLYRDVKNGELYNVFESKTLKYAKAINAFLEIMNEKSYQELHSVFLSKMTQMPKIHIHKLKQSSFEENRIFKNKIHQQLYNARYRGNGYLHCVRAISWVIYYGHYQILQYVLDRMIKAKGNVNDLFQYDNSISFQDNSDIEQDDTFHEEEISEHDSLVLSDKSDDESEIEIDSDSDSDTESDSDSETEIESETDISRDSIIGEQRRLLCLACYGNDLKTVQILLNYVNEETYKSKVKRSKPMIIVSKFGYLSIAKLMLQAGTDANLNASFDRSLVTACKNGHLNLVLELIKAGANVNQNYGNSTALTAACNKGHLNVVKALIKAGSRVNLNVETKTPLSEACLMGHLDVIKELICKGADPHGRVGSSTILSAACCEGHLRVVQFLINENIDVNASYEGKTPLTYACMSGHLDVVEELIKAGADVNLMSDNLTPLTAACLGGHLSVVKTLIKANASVNLNDGENTPLTAACEQGDLNIVQTIITAGANVNKKETGKSPLTIACENGHSSVVKYLIEKGANVNVKDSNMTPITAACVNGHLCVVEQLIKGGADVNLNDGKKIPLTTEHFMENVDLINLLITAGANVNQNDDNDTPLTIACDMGHSSEVQQLISAGADVNLRVGNKTPLTVACDRRHVCLAEELIKAGADINLSNGGKTPLTTACFRGELPLVELLINAGAIVNLSDGNNTPLKAVCEGMHMTAIDEIQKGVFHVNLKDDNKTDVMNSCLGVSMSVIQTLLNSGVILNETDEIALNRVLQTQITKN